MKILILGGTQFVGRIAALEAVSRGHDVTVFNRGTGDAPEGVTSLVGDRLSPDGYSALNGLSFDVVIDTWRTAAVVKTAIDALRGRIGKFIYVSSISVYDFGASAPPYSEASPLFDPETASEQYVKDKTGSEMEALKSGVPTVLARPGLILGPWEGIGRMPWWLRRLEKGGPTLAPAPQDLGVQFVDVRDLGSFLIHAAESSEIEGAYNIVSPQNHITLADFLETANKVSGGYASLRWLDSATVLAAGIEPWGELPIWVSPEDTSVYSIEVEKALKNGLKIRPAVETIADTQSWLKSLKEELVIPSFIGLDAEKEAAVLRKHFPEA